MAQENNRFRSYICKDFFDTPDLDAKEKLVLLYCALNREDDWVLYEKQTCDFVGYSKNTVKKAIKSLHEKGYIKLHKKGDRTFGCKYSLPESLRNNTVKKQLLNRQMVNAKPSAADPL